MRFCRALPTLWSTSLYRLAAVLLLCAFALAGHVRGQAITFLLPSGSSPDGGYPATGLTSGADGHFYGATGYQNYTTYPYVSNPGAIYSISPQGVETVLHTFTQDTSGYFPLGGMIPGTDGALYGLLSQGGANYEGAIYRIVPGTTASSSYSLLFNFAQVNGITASSLQGPLLEDAAGNFYGTAQFAYSNPPPYTSFKSYQGAIFVVSQSTGMETFLHLFDDGSVAKDGESPNGGMILASDGNFYGTTRYGGSGGSGIIYKVTPGGTYSILHNFDDGTVADDGQNPTTGLIQSTDGNFYGTTSAGGAGSNGTIYKMTPQGKVTILHSFSDGTLSGDGNTPSAPLIQGTDGNFYGTTSAGGGGSSGTVYEITPQGVYTILHSFNDGTMPGDGATPTSPILQAPNGVLYGTTSKGGALGKGTYFGISTNYPALTSAQTVTGIAGVPLTYRGIGSNGTTTYGADPVLGPLPDGLSLDAGTGVISGMPSSAGTTTSVLTLTNAAGTSDVTVVFNIAALQAPVIGGFASAYGAVNASFTYSIAASNFPTSYTAAPLPAGLTVDTTTGIISGKPTAAAVGTTSVSVTATNATGFTTATLDIVVSSGTPALSQAYVVVHRFNDGSVTNDGEFPSTIFQGFDGSLYGTTQAGGLTTAGTIFNVTAQGTASVLTPLGPTNTSSAITEPARSSDGLVQGCDGNFYGTAEDVGSSKGGFIYTVTPGGQVTALHHFGDGSVANDGTDPTPGLIQGGDGNFYGTTEFGGAAGEGCAYRMTPRGAITILHSFGDGTVTNDGQFPTCGLTQGPDGNFYGMTFGGGSATANAGTIFQMTPAGTVTIIHAFGDGTVTNDGAQPSAVLFLGDDGNLYGTTQAGGSFTDGCVFQVTTQGLVTILHSFGDGTVTNDGDTPVGPLIEGFDTNFYGTTSVGGANGQGTMFSITKAGVVTIIHSFGDATVTNDGAYPIGLTQTTGGNFYGVTETGGFGIGFGTVFAVLADQSPTLTPIFTGAAYEAGSVGQPFVFIPKALFGSSISAGSGGAGSAAVQAAVIKPQGVGTGITFWTESGMLPNLLQFSTTSGEIDHEPIVQGTFPINITPHNNVGAGMMKGITFYFDVPPVVSSPTTAYASVNVPFAYPIAVQSGYPFPSVFGMTQFPSWLTIDPTKGIVSGTPPGPGTYTFTVTATNIFTPVNMPSTKVITVQVSGGATGGPNISSAAAVTGQAGTPLSYTIVASNTPTTYGALVLPPGLTCDSTSGIISGTPTTEGVYPVPISAINGQGMAGAEVIFNIAKSAPPSITTHTVSALVNAPFSYQLPSTSLVSIYGAYDQGDPSMVQLPPGLSLDINSGILSGTPTSSGTYTIVISEANNYGSASSTLTLIVGSPIDYGTWATNHSFNGLPAATNYGDGVPNALKFLFDVNPSQAMNSADRSGLPTVSNDTISGTTYLVLTYRKYALVSGLTVSLESSSDLVTWAPVTPDIDQQVGNDANTGDPLIEMGINSTNLTRKFIRLNVISSP